MAAPFYCLSRIQASLCCGLRRLDLAFGEPWGPEETLRVVKWPLFHNGPSVYTIPPNPLSPFPLGCGTQTRGSWMINSTSLSTGLFWPHHNNEQECVRFLLSVPKHLLLWLMISLPSAAEPTGQPSSSSSSHGVHRWVSGVWEHLVKPAGSHRTAGHQCTRTGKVPYSGCWLLAHMQLSSRKKALRCNILLSNLSNINAHFQTNTFLQYLWSFNDF